MNNKKFINLIDTTQNIKDADELLTISHTLFQKRLSLLEIYLNYTTTDEEKRQIYEKANRVYSDYKNTVKEIESFIEFISLMQKDTYEQRIT